MTVIRTRLGLLDAAAIEAEWERVQRANAEYVAHPHVGNFSGYRAPCTSCTTPTYSKHGVCRSCQSKGDS